VTIAEGDAFPLDRLTTPLAGPAVVYFYPRDKTPGCETEARGFTELYDRFREAGLEVVGVSVDSEESHRSFAEECGIPFPLASDEDASLTSRLGILKEYGEHGSMAARVTYLLDSEGVVSQVWAVQDVLTHPGEVLEAALALSDGQSK
jgi:thioredoxin-dependent peroxiredoxin